MSIATDRIEDELDLLRARYPELEYQEQGRWVYVPGYCVPRDPPGWNRDRTDIAFQLLEAYPGKPPYGFYVPAGILFSGRLPSHYREPAPSQPPFRGDWGLFSWTVDQNVWQPLADVRAGSNLLNWVIGFADRFRERA